MEHYAYRENIAINLADATSDGLLLGFPIGVFTVGSKEKDTDVKNMHEKLDIALEMKCRFGFAWGCGNQLSFYQQYSCLLCLMRRMKEKRSVHYRGDSNCRVMLKESPASLCSFRKRMI